MYLLLCLSYANNIQFDKYKAEYDNVHSKCVVPVAATTGPSSSTALQDKEYGTDRLRAVIELRRQQQESVPMDSREELTRYENDLVHEDIKDILTWWKVSLFLFLLHNILITSPGQRAKVPCPFPNC